MHIETNVRCKPMDERKGIYGVSLTADSKHIVNILLCNVPDLDKVLLNFH